MLITKTRHEAVVAYKDAIIADLEQRRTYAKQFLEEGGDRETRLREEVYALEDRLASQQKTMERIFAANLRLASENQKLRYPPRDALGRFVRREKAA